MSRRLGVIFLLFILFALASCRGRNPEGQPAGSSEQAAGTMQDTPLVTTPGEEIASPEVSTGVNGGDAIAATLAELGAQAGLMPPHPFLTTLHASPDVVAPGELVQFESGEALTGSLEVFETGMDSIGFENGKASLEVPKDTQDGIYYVRVRTERGPAAWGRFRVSSSRGLWLQADRVYADGQRPTVLSVVAHGIPDGFVGGIFIGDSATPYVPDADGRLTPGPLTPAAELFGRPLFLDGEQTGPLQVRLEADPFAAPTGEARMWESNILPLAMCRQGASIGGEFDAPGYVNAVWVKGGLLSRARFGETGTFKIPVDPGVVLVQTYTLEGRANQALVQVGCGEEASLGSLEGVPSMVAPESPVGVIVLARFSQERSLFAPLLQAGAGEQCRSGLILPVVTVDGVLDEELTQAAGTALKAAIAEAAPEVSVVTQADIDAFIDEAAEAMEAGGYAAGLPALDLAISATHADFLINLRSASLGSRFPVAVNALPLQSGDAQARGSGSGSRSSLASSSFDVYQAFAQEFSHAAICGEVQPEEEEVSLGEQVALQYRLKDLSGEEVDGADVSISEPRCGELNPENGATENGLFETTYTYPQDDSCVENLEFSAEWGGPSGAVKTREAEAISHLYPAPLTMKTYVGYVPGVSSEATLSAGFTVLDNWDLQTDPGGMVSIGTTGDCKYLEGGQEVQGGHWYSRSSQGGHNAEGYVSFIPILETGTSLEGGQEGESLPQRAHLRFFARASAIPTRDDGIARSATGFAGNFSDVLTTGKLPSTVFLFDIENPARLPNIRPGFVWDSAISTDEGGYSALFFYKVIKCGTDAGLGGMEPFFSVNAELLTSFSDDEAGRTQGAIFLPQIDEERYQILLYAVTEASGGSIQDSRFDMYHSGIARLQVDLELYFVQDTPGE